MPTKAAIVTRSQTSSTVSTENLNTGEPLTFEQIDSTLINLRDQTIAISDGSTTTDIESGETITFSGASVSGNTVTITGGASATGLTFVGDDSSGTLIADGETIKVAGTQNITTAMSGDTLTITGPDLSSYITASSTDTLTNKSGNISQWTNDTGYLTSFTETNDLSSAVTWANVPDANITESSVTQHQSALSITESQISDLGTYLTAESNDLSSAVTWANVPDANITQSSVTQHQAALSITESQISDLAHFSGSYTDLTNKPTIPTNNTELANGAGYITASSTDTLTNKSGNVSQFTNDSGYKTSVSEADVTQHQSALSVTESQISDLGAYITDANITVVGDDSTGTSFSAKDNDNIKITGTQNTAVSVSGDTITVTGPDLSSYATTSYVDTEVAGLVDSAPGTLDTLNELAAALGDDANFATTTSTALGNRLRVDTNAQGLTTTQKTNAKTNLGLSTVATSGAYTDLSGLPTIPTNNTQLTNGAGYLTSFTETNDLSSAVTWANVPDANITQGSVTQHQAALSITESQVSDLGSYITASSTDTLTNKSGNISQWTNDSGYKTAVSESDVTAHQAALSITESQISDLSHFSGSYTDLTNKPTIPTNNNQLTNGAGYITDYTVTQSDVTAHQAALAVTESQISDLGSYTTASSTDTFTNKTLDANGTGNIISNIDIGNMTAAVIVTASETIGSNNNDTTIPTSAAVKAYADSVGGGGGTSLGDLTAVGSTLQSPSNADLTLDPGGTGRVNINGVYRLPNADGAANQVMGTNGSGVISFVDPTAINIDGGVADTTYGGTTTIDGGTA